MYTDILFLILNFCFIIFKSDIMQDERRGKRLIIASGEAYRGFGRNLRKKGKMRKRGGVIMGKRKGDS